MKVIHKYRYVALLLIGAFIMGMFGFTLFFLHVYLLRNWIGFGIGVADVVVTWYINARHYGK